MKKLSLEQMEVVEGGNVAATSCAGIGLTMIYLDRFNHAQYEFIINSGNTLMCTNADGNYVSFWSLEN